MAASAMTVRAAHDRRLVQPALVALARAVAGRMAVDAARMGQHLAELGEHRRRPRRRVADRRRSSPAARGCRMALGTGVGRSSMLIGRARQQRGRPAIGFISLASARHRSPHR